MIDLCLLQIATLAEAMAVARNASRVVGVYIEIIQPAFHNDIAIANGGTLQEDLVIRAINATTGTQTFRVRLNPKP